MSALNNLPNEATSHASVEAQPVLLTLPASPSTVPAPQATEHAADQPESPEAGPLTTLPPQANSHAADQALSFLPTTLPPDPPPNLSQEALDHSTDQFQFSGDLPGSDPVTNSDPVEGLPQVVFDHVSNQGLTYLPTDLPDADVSLPQDALKQIDSLELSHLPSWLI